MAKEILDGLVYISDVNSKDSSEIHTNYWGGQIVALNREQLMQVIQALKQGKELIIVVNEEYTLSFYGKDVNV